MIAMADQQIAEAVLRYHRKNPLRVAFATPQVIARHGADAIERVYQEFERRGLVEPMHHTVVRDGRLRGCYRITRQGLTATEADLHGEPGGEPEGETAQTAGAEAQ